MAATPPKVSANVVSMRTSAPVHSSSSSYFPDGDRHYHVVQSFPRHEIIKLREDTFVQWKHQLRLIIDCYRLTDYVNSTLLTPYRFMPDQEGIGNILSYFTGANTTQEVWSKATHLFVAASSAKISRLKHDLHSLKKGLSHIVARGFTVVTVGEIEADLNVRSMGVLATFPNVAITGLIGGLVNL
ncbi:hypothetical protein PVK06_011504 [Gossypium arboreum]|uniref:Uncharacterized protein n=1 Tax=Gossypium arboreum TaxID=29729 RepID=A0ABR0Q974_GOSAR|nr:hypothetical protein PVK06_011504 [Gossypium arboreum]